MDPRVLKTKVAYETIADIFREERENVRFPDEAISKFITICQEKHLGDNRIADLGSGTGTCIDHLLPAGISCIDAVEISDTFVQLLQNKYLAYPGIRVIHEDMIDYLRKQPDESVGAFVATFSIVHIPEEFVNPLFAHMQRSLVPGGLILLACHEGAFKGMEEPQCSIEHSQTFPAGMDISYYMNYFTLEELEKSLAHAGFSLLHTIRIPSPGEEKNVPGSHLWVLAEKNSSFTQPE